MSGESLIRSGVQGLARLNSGGLAMFVHRNTNTSLWPERDAQETNSRRKIKKKGTSLQEFSLPEKEETDTLLLGHRSMRTNLVAGPFNRPYPVCYKPLWVPENLAPRAHVASAHSLTRVCTKTLQEEVKRSTKPCYRRKCFALRTNCWFCAVCANTASIVFTLVSLSCILPAQKNK